MRRLNEAARGLTKVYVAARKLVEGSHHMMTETRAQAERAMAARLQAGNAATYRLLTAPSPSRGVN